MDKRRLLQRYTADYIQSHPKSEALFRKASSVQIGGGSHNLRLFTPFPFFDTSSSGSRVQDVDGRSYVDFWQGHFANILGHNPRFVTEALAASFESGQGLATGFPGIHQNELASLILRATGAESLRFTTSGTLATMYSIMLAKAFTGRDLVMKVGGGWHGAHPFALKGISVYSNGLNRTESAGLPTGADSSIIMTRFNDVADLEEQFRLFGERTACLIIEPFIGAGGFMFGRRDYLQTARRLSQEFETVLIFDEVVSGFRFHPGAVHTLYGLKPDLSVFGKAIGGGMPVSAVAGRRDVMALCGPQAGDKKVKFEGGTFSGHPSAMLAGKVFLNYLIEHESEIYPRLGEMGHKVRLGIEEIFESNGFHVRCTGGGGDITASSSLVGVHFLREDIEWENSPEQVWNPAVCDNVMREQLFKLAMLAEGFNIFHGYGALSTAHSAEEVQSSLDAVEKIAREWKRIGLSMND